MMLQPYHNPYKSKKASDLAVYCRTEGVDPLYFRSQLINIKAQLSPMKAIISLGFLFKKGLNRIGLSRKLPKSSPLAVSTKE